MKIFQLDWHMLSIYSGKNFMQNSPRNNNEDFKSLKAREERNTIELSENLSENISSEEVLGNQSSEEQKMKEKYISEVSKIEDAPGNGGAEKPEE
jgi:hypothetical protein